MTSQRLEETKTISAATTREEVACELVDLRTRLVDAKRVDRKDSVKLRRELARRRLRGQHGRRAVRQDRGATTARFEFVQRGACIRVGVERLIGCEILRLEPLHPRTARARARNRAPARSRSRNRRSVPRASRSRCIRVVSRARFRKGDRHRVRSRRDGARWQRERRTRCHRHQTRKSTRRPPGACPGKVDTGFPKRTCATIRSRRAGGAHWPRARLKRMRLSILSAFGARAGPPCACQKGSQKNARVPAGSAGW